MTVPMKNLVKLREKANLNQAQLAKMLDVTKITILRWEKGEIKPNSTALIKMAEIFNVSVDFLLDRIILLKQPDGCINYKFCTENDLLTGNIKYDFGIFKSGNNLKLFLVIEEINGSLINKIVESSGPYEFLTLICILNKELKFYYNPFKDDLDLIVKIFGKYQRLLINDIMSPRLAYINYEEYLNEWLMLSTNEKMKRMNILQPCPNPDTSMG